MNKSHRIWQSAICLLTLVIGLTTYTEAADSVPPELREFAHSFLAAARSGDPATVQSLAHSSSRSCQESAKEKYNTAIVNGIIRVFGPEQKVARIHYAKLSVDDASYIMKQGRDNHVNWPVTPEGVLFIEFAGESGARTERLHVAKDKGKWRWIYTCSR